MILLTGESHLGAVRRGAPERADVTYWPLGRGGDCATPFFVHDAQAKTVETRVSGWRNRVFSPESVTLDGQQAVVGVSMPLNTSRILRDYSWDTHVPWHLHQGGAEMALSNAAVDALMEQDYTHALAFVAALQSCGIKVFVIEAPHFFEQVWAEQPRGLDLLVPGARLDVISYLDAHYRQTVSAKLADMGVDVIEQPTDTLTARGSTKLKYSHEDPQDNHHANPAFGTIMFNEIVTYGQKVGALST